MHERSTILVISLVYCLVLFSAIGIADEARLTTDAIYARDHIVEIKIDLSPEDWNSVRKQSRSLGESLERNAVPQSPFTYVKGNVTIDGVLIRDVGIRKKGFLGSLDNERPSLKIKFAKYVDQAPVAGTDRLTLNNNKQDAAGLSHFLGFHFFRNTGTAAPRCNYATVCVNGTSLGIYSNVESIRQPLLEREFGDGTGALFEGTVADFYESSLGRFEKKNGAASDELLERLARILAKDELQLDDLQQIVDLDAFIRFWATESLIGFWDGYTNDQNNFFVYQNPTNRKLYFLPWGLDCAYAEKMPLPPFVIKPQFVYCRSLLANRLYRDTSTREQYQATLQSLLDEHWDEELLVDEIARTEARIRPLILDTNRGFDDSIVRIRDFINNRRNLLTREMKQEFMLDMPAKQLPYSRVAGFFKATFDTHWYDTTPEDGKIVGATNAVLELDNEKVAFRELGVFAERSKWPPLPPGVPKPPALIYYGSRKANDRNLILGFGIQIDDFGPTDKPIKVDGLLIDGPLGATDTKYKMMTGTITLEQADMKEAHPLRVRSKFLPSKSWMERRTTLAIKLIFGNERITSPPPRTIHLGSARLAPLGAAVCRPSPDEPHRLVAAAESRPQDARRRHSSIRPHLS